MCSQNARQFLILYNTSRVLFFCLYETRNMGHVGTHHVVRILLCDMQRSLTGFKTHPRDCDIEHWRYIHIHPHYIAWRMALSGMKMLNIRSFLCISNINMNHCFGLSKLVELWNDGALLTLRPLAHTHRLFVGFGSGSGRGVFHTYRHYRCRWPAQIMYTWSVWYWTPHRSDVQIPMQLHWNW
jgi:hypothetical protein